MRFTWMALLSAAFVFAGCTAGPELSTTDTGGGPPIVTDGASIAFAHEGTLALAPREVATVEVITDPAAPYELSFLLLGNAFDASLDHTTALADPDGRASVTLQAPSTSATFRLRATIEGGNSADLAVAVSDQGFGSVEVTPEYSGGRPVDTWHAGVLAGTTCEELAGVLPDDPEGALTVTAPETEAPVVDVAPVGPNLAVYLRAERYAWGCTDESDLEPNETKTVGVQVVDVPVDATNMLLAMDLGFAPEPKPWGMILTTGLQTLLPELGSTTPAPELLLAAMKAASNDPNAFESAATNNDWQTALYTHFSDNQIDLVTTIESYAQAGVGAQPPIIEGTLEAIENTPTHAELDLAAIGDASPAALALPNPHVLTFEVDPDDVVHLGGTLPFLPGRYVAHAVEEAALSQNTQADEMVDVLSQVVLCDQLSLTGLSGCSSTCIENLCRDGLGIMWQAALDAAATATVGEIQMQISGEAGYDESATLTGFAGMWVGKVNHGSTTAEVSGAVAAAPPDPPQ